MSAWPPEKSFCELPSNELVAISSHKDPYSGGIYLKCVSAIHARNYENAQKFTLYLSRTDIAYHRIKSDFQGVPSEEVMRKLKWYDAYVKPIEDFGNGILQSIESHLSKYSALIKEWNLTT